MKFGKLKFILATALCGALGFSSLVAAGTPQLDTVKRGVKKAAGKTASVTKTGYKKAKPVAVKGAEGTADVSRTVYKGGKKGVTTGYKYGKSGTKTGYKYGKRGARATYRGGRWVVIKTKHGLRRVFVRNRTRRY